MRNDEDLNWASKDMQCMQWYVGCIGYIGYIGYVVRNDEDLNWASKDMHAVIVSLGLSQDEWSDHGPQEV